MLRIVYVLLMLIGAGLPAGATNLKPVPPDPLSSAMSAMQGGRWDVAANLADRAGPAGADLVEWHRLRAGHGKPSEIVAFLQRNGDWPGLDYLRKQSEEAMLSASDDDVLAFYKSYTPQSGRGVLNLARALNATGHAGEAEATLVLAWRTMDLTTAEHNAFITAHGNLLKPHHTARLEMALWRGLKDVQQMLPLVTPEQRKLAGLRQKIENDQKGIDSIIAALPKEQRDNPGIAYEMFNRHIRLKQDAKAIKLILHQSRIENGLGRPERWAGWRRAIARSQMREGNTKLAYDLASVHQLAEGSNYADLEWLSGYLALTYLDDAELALKHFQRFRVAVRTPISLGRAGYWIGRAQEALGDHQAAATAYAEGARYQSSFYGLLAADKAGLPMNQNFAGDEHFPPWRDAEFTRSRVYQAGLLALSSGQLNMAERFFVHLAQSQDRTGLGQMGAMLAELDQPHLQVMLGKAAARRGLVIHAPYFPLHPLHEMDLPVPSELALSIARRESEFDTRVASGAGAQGLMQLMPGTARDVARDLGLAHDRARVLGDWRYNAQLGSAYLAYLAERFDGNIVMISAGYNAGPGRPVRWMDTFGDPRQDGMDVVDWIEHIPFRETRNYVMRVAESVPVYRARLGKPPHPVPFSQELEGSTILVKLDITE